MKAMQKNQNPQGNTTGGNVPLPNIKKRGVAGFFRDVRREMKHVEWPTGKETGRLTGVVLGVCLLVILFLQVLGMGFGWILDLIFKARG